MPFDTAMVLAAGLGTRMRPITDRIPKPLVEVQGRTLIDRALDALVAANVRRVVINVHYLAEPLIDHLAKRGDLEIVISDERDELLDSAGGIVKALPKLGARPFYILNADTFWIDAATPNLLDLAGAWQEDAMDLLLLLADPAQAHGHERGSDFVLDKTGRLDRARGRPGQIYAGAGIVHPRIFAGAEPVRHSLNLYFDRAIEAGRLHGRIMKGEWITVGTPDAIAEAEGVLAALEAVR